MHAKHDVIVVGSGIAGASAAIAAAKTGGSVLLVGSEGAPGGDACTGMPILGTYTSRGEKCVGGVLDELLEIIKTFPGGYIGPVCDYRTVFGLCINPDAMRLAIFTLLKRYGVKLLLNMTVHSVDVDDAGRVIGVTGIHASGNTQTLHAKFFVDATGSANIVRMAGGDVLRGGEKGDMQPVSLIFRMSGVQYEPFLRFVRDNPGEALLAQNPVLETDPARAAQLLYDGGYPYIALAATGKLLGSAIEKNEMYPCTAVFTTPVCVPTGEVCLNTTRVAYVDADDVGAASEAALNLSGQVCTAVQFLTARVPGFENAVLSGVASRLGVRETGRIVGDQTLDGDEALAGKKFDTGIGLASHHVDIHGAGTDQLRIPIDNGGAYGIPLGALQPKKLRNVLAAGRCISSDRRANGSVRVMGSCMVTGHAAGVASSLGAAQGVDDIRAIDAQAIRETLREQGAIL